MRCKETQDTEEVNILVRMGWNLKNVSTRGTEYIFFLVKFEDNLMEDRKTE